MNEMAAIYRSKVFSQLGEIHNFSDIITVGLMELNIGYSTSILGNVRLPFATLINKNSMV
jgi:hypothetical protein